MRKRIDLKCMFTCLNVVAVLLNVPRNYHLQSMVPNDTASIQEVYLPLACIITKISKLARVLPVQKGFVWP